MLVIYGETLLTMALSLVWCFWTSLRHLTACVDHSILLAKLPFYGIRGSSLAWLTNYLQDRQQRVYLDNVYSEWGKITHRVSQSSFLGPILFCLHISYLPSCIQNCKIHVCR